MPIGLDIIQPSHINLQYFYEPSRNAALLFAICPSSATIGDHFCSKSPITTLLPISLYQHTMLQLIRNQAKPSPSYNATGRETIPTQAPTKEEHWFYRSHGLVLTTPNLERDSSCDAILSIW
ncbi:hypothetical protein ACJW30_07G162800 [Castanea mollissima]